MAFISREASHKLVVEQIGKGNKINADLGKENKINAVLRLSQSVPGCLAITTNNMDGIIEHTGHQYILKINHPLLQELGRFNNLVDLLAYLRVTSLCGRQGALMHAIGSLLPKFM